MGAIISRLFERQGEARKILMLGLDAAGKTTTLYAMLLDRFMDTVNTVPTIGLNVELVQHKRVNIANIDVGGHERLRHLLRRYFYGTEGLVYVVDSWDADRLKEAAEELHHTLADPLMRDVPILVLANKQDLPGALDAGEVARGLGMEKLTGKFPWFVQPCSAKSGTGVKEGMGWLNTAMEDLALRRGG